MPADARARAKAASGRLDAWLREKAYPLWAGVGFDERPNVLGLNPRKAPARPRMPEMAAEMDWLTLNDPFGPVPNP